MWRNLTEKALTLPVNSLHLKSCSVYELYLGGKKMCWSLRISIGGGASIGLKAGSINKGRRLIVFMSVLPRHFALTSSLTSLIYPRSIIPLKGIWRRHRMFTTLTSLFKHHRKQNTGSGQLLEVGIIFRQRSSQSLPSILLKLGIWECNSGQLSYFLCVLIAPTPTWSQMKNHLISPTYGRAGPTHIPQRSCRHGEFERKNKQIVKAL